MHNKNTIKNILVSSIIAIGLSWLLYAFTIDPNINNAFQLIQRIWVTDNGTTTGETIIDLNTGSNNIYIGTGYLPITAPYNSAYLLTLNSDGYISFTTGNNWITGVVVSGVNIIGNSLMVTLTNGTTYSGGTLPSGWGGWAPQVITLNDTILSLDPNGGTIDLTGFLQTISLSNDILSITSGNNISLSEYKQTLSLVGSGLSISSGNTVYLEQSPWITGSIPDTITARGRGNTVSGTHSIAWGSGNTILSIWSTIAWGYNNTISSSNYSFIGGGEGNIISWSEKSSIIGWATNIISWSIRSTIIGDGIRLEDGWFNLWLGYLSNIVSGSSNVTIGSENSISTGNENYSLGMRNNITNGNGNYILGVNNIITSFDGNLVLWYSNSINNTRAGRVIGDGNNINNWIDNTAIGSNNNIAVTTGSTAIGSRNSISDWVDNTAIGSDNNITTSTNSIAMGYLASINNSTLSFFWNDGSLSTVNNLNNVFIIGATGGVGINTVEPQTDLHVQWWSILGSVTSVAVIPAGNNIWNTTIQSTTLQSYQYIAIEATQSGAIVQVQLEPLSSPKDNGKEITIFKYNEDVNPFTIEFGPDPNLWLPDNLQTFLLFPADNNPSTPLYSQIWKSKSATFIRYESKRHLIHAI